ncbi:hypothetical protein LMH87_003468 [Akanthomyces muscarius]|uniref:Uncharacterized protein n=1 Tax=Akanthomyces muscarius TaxID=2231603 RepID=A0A9W8Q200_AKAMU|nr:hypothetical protein LMH87_003468 [Akanthomyces muscarius]KAJ4144589.1 hypothetical protein LMH87_003468 [Akanthomyces muscarius]
MPNEKEKVVACFPATKGLVLVAFIRQQLTKVPAQSMATIRQPILGSFFSAGPKTDLASAGFTDGRNKNPVYALVFSLACLRH